ncbi:MAG: transcription termination/antitermination protein NusA [Bacteroidales bacterium]|jgi:N utilization substance protein A|nr:transcription termination/antitermination protein NusA [Bacteroidales bacterium]MBQ5577091.1 transcription termination/antitermination protein NusA [Bacteroidales bacterium]MBR4271658.1 transcription termination/antitermination protein NusA [Bacteroidales bacterium]
MEINNLIESFAEFKEQKSIDRATMMRVIEEVFRSILAKRFGTDENFDIIINIDRGDLEIWRNRVVVEDGDVQDPNLEISLSEAKSIDSDYEIDEEVTDEVKFQDFGRRAILTLRQNLTAKILEFEKEKLYEKYKNRIGEVVSGEVYQVWKREILVRDEDGNDLSLPKQEQIPSDFFRKGDTLKAVISNVEMKNGTPSITLSRTSPAFLERLFEMEVPEILDGLITIKKIVRIPGERAKVAVESYDERIDPVGACVGMKGSRIHGIVRELRNENIDVVPYTNNIPLFVQRTLSPATINDIRVVEAEKKVEVYLDPEEVSKAIGKNGSNIKLAGQLTGYDIEVFRDIEEGAEDDVDLKEFTDEIEGWIIDTLKSIGCDTARDVLNIPREELIRRTDLEEETIDEVIKIFKEELEQE